MSIPRPEPINPEAMCSGFMCGFGHVPHKIKDCPSYRNQQNIELLYKRFADLEAYDKLVGTPCEQIRHKQEIEAKDEVIAKLVEVLNSIQKVINEEIIIVAEVRELIPHVDKALAAAQKEG